MATDKDFLTQPAPPFPAHLCFLMLTGSRGPETQQVGKAGGRTTSPAFYSHFTFESLSFHSHIIKSGIHCVFVFLPWKTKGAICLWFFITNASDFSCGDKGFWAGLDHRTLRRERHGEGHVTSSQEYCRSTAEIHLSDGISVRIK